MSAPGKLTAGVLALVLVGTLAGCSTESAGTGVDVTVGSHGTLEGEILAQAYGQTLAAHGYIVDYNYGIGGYSRGVSALRDGTIDLIPDLSSGLLASVNPHSTSNTSTGILSELPKALAPLGLAILDPALAETTRAFVTTRQFEEAHSLEKIGDLSLFASAVTIGGPAGFESSSYGRTALTNRYGVTDWKAKTARTEEQIVDDLRFNRTQVAVLPMSSPGILANDFVVLEDPQHIMPSSQVVPLIAARKYTPDYASIIDSVSHRMTTAQLASLIGRAPKADTPPDEARTVETIVHEWLSEQDLLDPDLAE